MAIKKNEATPNVPPDDPFASYNRKGAGSPVGSVTPEYAGEIYLNSSTGVEYVARGLTSATWALRSGGGASGGSDPDPDPEPEPDSPPIVQDRALSLALPSTEDFIVGTVIITGGTPTSVSLSGTNSDWFTIGLDGKVRISAAGETSAEVGTATLTVTAENEFGEDTGTLTIVLYEISDDYPASVIAKGLEAVYDLRVGGSSLVGCQVEPTHRYTDGTPSLSGVGMSLDGAFLYVYPDSDDGEVHTLEEWVFDDFAAAHGRVVTATGTGATTMKFKNCRFVAQDEGITTSYMVDPNDSSQGTTEFEFCEFDGSKLQGSSLSAIFSHVSGKVIMRNCIVKNMPGDAVKSASWLEMYNCRIEAPGWDVNSDPDGIQVGQGYVKCEECLFDVRDASILGDEFTGQPLNNFFRVESFGGEITGVDVQRCIFVGIDGYGSLPGAYIALAVKDQNPYDFTGTILYKDNIVQPGHNTNGYTYCDGLSNRTQYLHADEWVDNVDYDTGADITQPIDPSEL